MAQFDPLARAMRESEYKTELAAEASINVENEPTRIFRGTYVRELLSGARELEINLAVHAAAWSFEIK